MLLLELLHPFERRMQGGLAAHNSQRQQASQNADSCWGQMLRSEKDQQVAQCRAEKRRRCQHRQPEQNAKNHENCAGKGFFVELHDDSSFAAKGSCVIGLKAEALHLDVLFFQLMIDLFRVGLVVKRKCVRQGLYGVFEVRERGAVIVILQDL